MDGRLRGKFPGAEEMFDYSPSADTADIRKDFQVYCDTSRLGLGSVLMQDGRVVSYA